MASPRYLPPNRPATAEGSDWKRGVVGYDAGPQKESDTTRGKQEGRKAKRCFRNKIRNKIRNNEKHNK